MADVKISALPAATTPLAGSEVLPIVQSGTTDQVTVANLTAGRTVAAATISVNAGTVSAPSITFSGDSNTGIYSPTADTIAFTEGGSEAMRIDSSSNIGIGTSSPASRLNVAGGRSLFAANSEVYNVGVAFAQSRAAGGQVFFIGATDSATPDLVFSNSGGLERARITSTGNVGIGNPSPANKLDLFTNAATTVGVNVGNSVNAWSTGVDSSGNYSFYSNGAYNIIFSNSGVERARITSGGEVYIAGTTDQGAYNLQVNGTGVWGAGAYVNGSDARIKDDVSPLSSGLDVVTKLKPVTYRYKESWSKDTSLQPGFIAQDLQAALADQPYVDGVVLQGPEYLSVAYQSLIPLLTKAVQELKADNDALKARVAALEAK